VKSQDASEDHRPAERQAEKCATQDARETASAGTFGTKKESRLKEKENRGQHQKQFNC
jgi:hypothetical protein